VRLRLTAILFFLAAGLSGAPPRKPDVILITLDTTRSDAVGAYGARTSTGGSTTPAIDAIAARGIRYDRAFAPTPLTLPSHASLLSGLDPPAHGVHDNGVESLPASIPTLATILRGQGYATAAFVATRVLDRRFGLGRGFETYDDAIAAEQIGEAGYAERTAEQVTNAAAAALQRRKDTRPLFLWVHYYDAHAPYGPPSGYRGVSDLDNYRGEVRYVDAQLARLFAVINPGPDAVIAIVGDHGESLGQHGEREHGIFLYSAVMHVPMIIAGGAAPRGKAITEAVGTTRLTRTILQLAGVSAPAAMAPALPGIGAAEAARAMYSETNFPASAYGWSPLKAYTDQRWRAVLAPRPELYDLTADPQETRNVVEDNRREFFRLQGEMKSYEASLPRVHAVAVASDPEIAAALRSLGYVTGGTPGKGSLDPKEGVALLEEGRQAEDTLREGQSKQAAAVFERLVSRNPTNVYFVTNLAAAQLAGGAQKEAITTYRRAVAMNPQLDFLHLNLADALRKSGREQEAIAEYRVALKLNPRMAAPAIRIAEMNLAHGKRTAARDELRRAIAAGVHSASIHTRLARLELEAGDLAAAEKDARAAMAVADRWSPAWVVLGDIQRRGSDDTTALRSYQKAIEVDPGNAEAWLQFGKLLQKRGDTADARRALRRVVELAPDSGEAAEARRLLAGN
jgi:arylsulfatase A-like enzyme/Flp pilus assembly protein TadD